MPTFNFDLDGPAHFPRSAEPKQAGTAAMRRYPLATGAGCICAGVLLIVVAVFAFISVPHVTEAGLDLEDVVIMLGVAAVLLACLTCGLGYEWTARGVSERRSGTTKTGTRFGSAMGTDSLRLDARTCLYFTLAVALVFAGTFGILALIKLGVGTYEFLLAAVIIVLVVALCACCAGLWRCFTGADPAIA